MGAFSKASLLQRSNSSKKARKLILPPWIGKEVTGDSFYKKTNMRERALKPHRQEQLVRSDAVRA
jgi:CYTH domain-containing protein